MPLTDNKTDSTGRDIPLTGNKGEWSEIYTLLKIVADQALQPGDQHLHSIENFIYPIIMVLRNESEGRYQYTYDQDIVIIQGNDEKFRVPLSQFKEYAALLLHRIKKSSETFSVPEVEEFIRSFHCTSLKASSSIKSDIRIVVHDQRTGTTPELGFSIKSQLGKASTLLNAGRTTNFIFEVRGVYFSEEAMEEINAIDTRSKIKDRLERIQRQSGSLVFAKTEKITFGNNLTLIDSSLPTILAQMLYTFYTSSHSKMSDLVRVIAQENPLGYDVSEKHPFYQYKIKRFLSDVALGMVPSEPWDGQLDATGGYLIVRDDGEVLCYHIYNRNDFESYLLNNTKLETASSGRHGFGTVYKENDAFYFKLNLQVRFIR